uniref:Uncharacterized protein n=1 Tax=viral metagenome TaxID=1070528 RepID=A0A6C0CM68_9ZZZZ
MSLDKLNLEQLADKIDLTQDDLVLNDIQATIDSGELDDDEEYLEIYTRIRDILLELEEPAESESEQVSDPVPEPAPLPFTPDIVRPPTPTDVQIKPQEYSEQISYDFDPDSADKRRVDAVLEYFGLQNNSDVRTAVYEKFINRGDLYSEFLKNKSYLKGLEVFIYKILQRIALDKIDATREEQFLKSLKMKKINPNRKDMDILLDNIFETSDQSKRLYNFNIFLIGLKTDLSSLNLSKMDDLAVIRNLRSNINKFGQMLDDYDSTINSRHKDIDVYQYGMILFRYFIRLDCLKFMATKQAQENMGNVSNTVMQKILSDFKKLDEKHHNHIRNFLYYIIMIYMNAITDGDERVDDIECKFQVSDQQFRDSIDYYEEDIKHWPNPFFVAI